VSPALNFARNLSFVEDVDSAVCWQNDYVKVTFKAMRQGIELCTAPHEGATQTQGQLFVEVEVGSVPFSTLLGGSWLNSGVTQL
jgi:hypothetical protein